VSSKNALNFAYALYLVLRQDPSYTHGTIQSIVRRWFVMASLTGRYSSTVETSLEADIRRVIENGAEVFLDEIERSELSDNFWKVTLPLAMNSSSTKSPPFLVFQAA